MLVLRAGTLHTWGPAAPSCLARGCCPLSWALQTQAALLDAAFGVVLGGDSSSGGCSLVAAVVALGGYKLSAFGFAQLIHTHQIIKDHTVGSRSPCCPSAPRCLSEVPAVHCASWVFHLAHGVQVCASHINTFPEPCWVPRVTSVTRSVDMKAGFVLSTALDAPKEFPESQRAERGGQMGTKSWEGWGTSKGAGDEATNPLDLGRGSGWGSGLGGGGATSDGDGLSWTGSCPEQVSSILSCDPEGPVSQTGGPRFRVMLAAGTLGCCPGSDLSAWHLPQPVCLDLPEHGA